jgi:LPS O-antigen subunit length determinant protein (WzzB/FepE family)
LRRWGSSCRLGHAPRPTPKLHHQAQANKHTAAAVAAAVAVAAAAAAAAVRRAKTARVIVTRGGSRRGGKLRGM